MISLCLQGAENHIVLGKKSLGVLLKIKAFIFLFILFSKILKKEKKKETMENKLDFITIEHA